VKWNQPSILGYSDTCTVKLDFDDTDFRTVKYCARGFIILRSSEKSYHVVFDRPVSWSENFRIMSWVAILSKNCKLKDYCLMQGIKARARRSLHRARHLLLINRMIATERIATAADRVPTILNKLWLSETLVSIVKVTRRWPIFLTLSKALK
jgi:hypothetical protein